jgi:hypothetical protein
MGLSASLPQKLFKSITARFVDLASQNPDEMNGSKDWKQKAGGLGATQYQSSCFHMTGSSFNQLLQRPAAPPAERQR